MPDSFDATLRDLAAGARRDQLTAALRTLADLVSDYYRLLVERGIPEQSAMILAGAAQAWFLASGQERAGE